MIPEGLLRFASSYTVSVTIDRLAEMAVQRGMAVFARIDHTAGAAAAGLSIPPTELLVFGNARSGTPLMQVAATIGIDLPLKALAWQNERGGAWLAFNDPAWVARRHGLPVALDVTLQTMRAGLVAIAHDVLAPD